MSDQDDRRAKLERLRSAGIEPFPHSFAGAGPIRDVHDAHADLEAGAETDSAYRVAGRLAARRGHGKAAFMDLADRSGRIQLHAREDVLGEERFERLTSLDLGDLIGVDGTAFKSRRGELSLRVDSWELLAKSLRAPPEKFHGLEDVETRYRHRELDLIANEEARELFTLRSRVISAMRRWLDERGFLEVETPVLQPLYGGALARPFTTHHNALDRDLYLRIATELYLKRLIVGGLERVYELGKDFRNEGVSHKHNPEFTMLEWYEAYADYNDIAAELEELVSFVAGEVGYSGEIDFTPPWRRVTLQEAILEKTGVDVLEHRDRDSLVAAAREKGIELPANEAWPQLVDDLLSKHVEPDLMQPTFVMDYPVELSPFAKRHREHEGLVERFECFAAGHGVLERVHRAERPRRPARPLRGAEAPARGGRRGDAALRRGLRVRSRARDAAHGRDRHRDRPPGDDPRRPALDPRGRAVPRDALTASIGALRCSMSMGRGGAAVVALAVLALACPGMAAAADPPPCRGSHLEAIGVWSRSTPDHVLYGQVRLVNTSARDCIWRGRPRLELVNGRGELIASSNPAVPLPERRRRFRLRARQPAPPAGPTPHGLVVLFHWSNWCGEVGVPARVRITPPSRIGHVETVPRAPDGGPSYPSCAGSSPTDLTVSELRRPAVRRWRVHPRHGGPLTTFRFRYWSPGSDNNGDQLYLYGPPGTRCRGEIAQTPTGFARGTQTILLGPRARGSGPRTFAIGADVRGGPFRRWCRGLYRGVIRWEGWDVEEEIVVGRFFFRVR